MSESQKYNDVAATAASVHELHDFVAVSQRRIQEAYDRIQKRATEDPGTAGDQAEEDWAKLLREWLPPYFQVVTKGRILAPSGIASPHVDVLVLMPSYPQGFLSQKLYMAGGIAAAFECKTTLKADHIRCTLETSSEIQRAMPKRDGSPYKELNSPIIYGLLAHSHSWKAENSKPIEIVSKTLFESDSTFVRHPREAIDILCVADLGTWTVTKMNGINPNRFSDPVMATLYGGHANSGYMCHAKSLPRQEVNFSPLGTLFSALYHKLAWAYPDMRNLDDYFGQVRLRGTAEGISRNWDLSIYSEKTRDKVLNGECHNPGGAFDEWSQVFF
jgi:hypothetical protein